MPLVTRLVLLLAVASCGRIGYDGAYHFEVEPVYPIHGAGWTTYVANQNGGASRWDQPDEACDVTTRERYSERCLHAGVLRMARIPYLESCDGVTAEDSLGAFRWECVERSDEVTLFSRGLAPGKGLRDLVDASGFREIVLHVYQDGSRAFRSAPGPWWPNRVQRLPLLHRVASLASPDTIYVLPTSWPSAGHRIEADGVGVVSLPGARLLWTQAEPTFDTECSTEGEEPTAILLCGAEHERAWLEIDIDAAGVVGEPDRAIFLRSMNQTRVHNSYLQGRDRSGRGLTFQGGRGNLQSAISADGWWIGVHIYYAAQNSVVRAQVTNNSYGVVEGSGGGGNGHPVYHDIVASNNVHGFGFGRHSYDATVTRLLSVHNQSSGIGRLGSGGGNDDRHAIHLSSMVNNGEHGLTMRLSDLTVSSFVAANNGGSGLHLDRGEAEASNHYVNVASVNNGVGVSLAPNAGELGNEFHGYLVVGNNEIDDCQAGELVSGGVVTGTCTDSGEEGSSSYAGHNSTARLFIDRDASASFLGALEHTGAAGPDELASIAAFEEIADWSHLGAPTRAWAKQADGDWSSVRGACEPGEICQIRDFALRSSDSLLRNRSRAFDEENEPFVAQAPCPAAVHGDVIARVQSDAPRPYLLNAYEIVGDGIGNEDGLCESFESCIYAPNIGYYQGADEHETVGPCQFADSAGDGIVGAAIYAKAE